MMGVLIVGRTLWVSGLVNHFDPVLQNSSWVIGLFLEAAVGLENLYQNLFHLWILGILHVLKDLQVPLQNLQVDHCGLRGPQDFLIRVNFHEGLENHASF